MLCTNSNIVFYLPRHCEGHQPVNTSSSHVGSHQFQACCHVLSKYFIRPMKVLYECLYGTQLPKYLFACCTAVPKKKKTFVC